MKRFDIPTIVRGRVVVFSVAARDHAEAQRKAQGFAKQHEQQLDSRGLIYSAPQPAGIERVH
jgi:hypothetical protein